MNISTTQSPSNLSICSAEIPDQMVIKAVDAITTRVEAIYLDSILQAKENPEIISEYKTILSDYYKKYTNITSEQKIDLAKGQKMAPNLQVISRSLDSSIKIFAEKNQTFHENQPIEQARVYIKLKVDAKDLKKEDSLNHLLAQLFKKILSQGFGDDGTFDIRLEKGILSLEGNPWKWHYDGFFKSSVTVCFSNKENWSTRVSDSKFDEDGKPSNHGYLYDALKVYHRAPIPSDVQGEIKANEYRLFIRYNEYNKPTKPSESEKVVDFSENIAENDFPPENDHPNLKNLFVPNEINKSLKFDFSFIPPSVKSDIRSLSLKTHQINHTSINFLELEKAIKLTSLNEIADLKIETKYLKIDLKPYNFTSTSNFF